LGLSAHQSWVELTDAPYHQINGVIVVGIAAAYWPVLMARRSNPPAASND